MRAQRFGITVLAVASIATAIGAGAGLTGTTPPWLHALNARSDALNREHELGAYAERHALGAPGPSWLEALQARSEALNRHHGLGEFARQASRASSDPAWLVALNARSDALNRQYGLGEYAAKRGSSG